VGQSLLPWESSRPAALGQRAWRGGALLLPLPALAPDSTRACSLYVRLLALPGPGQAVASLSPLPFVTPETASGLNEK